MAIVVDFIMEYILPGWVKHILGIVVVITALFVAYFVIHRVRKGDEISFFKLKIKPNKLIEKQREEFRKLNSDSKQKSQVIKALNQASLEISSLSSSGPSKEFNETKVHIYDLLLFSIGIVLTKEKSNIHRVAIFVDNGDGNLRIHEGFGFSVDGKKYLRLEINDSAAGHVFRTGTPYKSGDVEHSGDRFKIHPKATKSIKSLMCVPVKCGKLTLGVLSIDGQEHDSFTKDDLDYLTYFANALAPLMYLEHINELNKEEENSDQNYEGETNKQLA